MSEHPTAEDGQAETTRGHEPAHNARADGMNAHLQKAYRQVRKAYNEICRVEVPARYKIGRTINKVMTDPGRYGKAGVTMIAEALGCAKSALYDAAQVARTWKPAQFKSVRVLLDVTPEWTASWSHYIVLSSVESPERRETLMHEIRNKRLSVRQLKKMVMGARPVRKEKDAQTTNLARALRRLKSEAETFAAREAYRSVHIYEVLDVVGEELSTPKMQRLLRDVRTSLQLFGRVVQNELAKIEKCIAPDEESQSGSEGAPNPSAEGLGQDFPNVRNMGA